MIIVYVAGPYRGPDFLTIEENIRRAEKAAIELWDEGFGVFCPHLNTDHFEVKSTALTENYLEADLHFLKTCDAVLLIEGWESSAGAVGEVAVARTSGIPFFFSITALKAWRDSQCQNPAEIPTELPEMPSE